MAVTAELLDLICQSIEQRAVLEIRYAAEPFVRVLEPHALGTTFDDNAILVGWQYLTSKPGSSGGWKRLRLERVASMESSTLHFKGARPGFRPGDPIFRDVVCELH